VNQFHGQVDFEEFEFEVFRTLFIEPGFTAKEYISLSENEITERLYKSIRDAYKRKQEVIAKQAYPVIKDVFEKQGKQYENIVVPITDGVRVYHILTNLEKAYKSRAEDLMRSYEKSIMLAIIDDAWKEHLRELDDLRQSVQTATYEQKDPLLIYKFESFELFRTMVDTVNKQLVGVLLKGQIPIRDSSDVQRGQAPRRTDYSQMEANKSEYQPNAPGSEMPGKRGDEKVQPVRVEKKVGRNDLCPCGSGKKYKNCHGAQSTAARI
jgi:preprotein translocase subunit SecA